jgi:hypothetical protein
MHTVPVPITGNPFVCNDFGGSTSIGIQVTDYTNVALFDSVTGFAFGPTFEDEEYARAFLQLSEAVGIDDLRKLGNDTMQELFDLWYHANEEGEGSTVYWDGTTAVLNAGEWSRVSDDD